MIDLKRCPFCGGKAELVAVPTAVDLEWLVKCKKGCCNQKPVKVKADAIASWNRRVNYDS